MEDTRSKEEILKLIKAEMREHFSASPEDVIEEYVGKENLNRLRKKRVTPAKEPVTTPSQVAKDVPKQPSEEKGDKKPVKKQTFNQF